MISFYSALAKYQKFWQKLYQDPHFPLAKMSLASIYSLQTIWQDHLRKMTLKGIIMIVTNEMRWSVGEMLSRESAHLVTNLQLSCTNAFLSTTCQRLIVNLVKYMQMLQVLVTNSCNNLLTGGVRTACFQLVGNLLCLELLYSTGSGLLYPWAQPASII